MEINLNTDFQVALLNQSANDLLMHYIWVWINSLKYNFGRQSILYWFELKGVNCSQKFRIIGIKVIGRYFT